MVVFGKCVVGGCKKPSAKKGYCNAHYLKWYRYGDPLIDNTAPKRRWLVEQLNHGGDECVLWPFSVNPNGYAKIAVNGKNVGAHRFICALAHGEPENPDLEAAHSCGVRLCVNPRHLRWKTPRDNSLEKREHGTIANGERNGNSSLTASDVLEIRSLRGLFTQRKIASVFGVSQATVNRLQLGQGWEHLQRT